LTGKVSGALMPMAIAEVSSSELTTRRNAMILDSRVRTSPDRLT
jgi:hypothetical protein